MMVIIIKFMIIMFMIIKFMIIMFMIIKFMIINNVHDHQHSVHSVLPPEPSAWLHQPDLKCKTSSPDHLSVLLNIRYILIFYPYLIFLNILPTIRYILNLKSLPTFKMYLNVDGYLGQKGTHL